MKKLKIYSSQFNYQYGNSIHFPYSIASLFAYIKSFPELDKQLQFEKTFIFRNKLDEYVDRIKDPDILLCSCYVWNWEITNMLAKRVKEKYPDCKVIYGGPQVPLKYEGNVPTGWVENSTGNFFKDYPHVDVLVHQEGEYTIKNLFEKIVNNELITDVGGIETADFRTLAQDRIWDLDTLPSPYLTDLVWDLIEPVEGVEYIAAWETNRGCPFQCTFCDWGSATKTKVRKWDMDKLFEEIEWFANNKIPYIDCCDANFGIFTERDLSLAKKLSSEKKEKGFPGRIRPAWTKSSSDKVIPVAKELLDADLLRAVTLAVQSLDPTTLEVIKRRNIKFDKFGELVQKFRNEKIENYTELIMGMPGETLSSYKIGLEQLMELFPRPVVFIYNCGVFVNAPMNEPNYAKKYDIQTIKSPIYLWHSSVNNRGEIPEYEDTIVSTNTFDLDELKEMYVYGWFMQAFHSLGITEYLSKFYNQVYDLKYIDFYTSLKDYCENFDSMLKTEYDTLRDYIDIGYDGGGWNHYDESLAEILWPIEEATWLRCVKNSNTLQNELFKFIEFLEKQRGFETDINVISDLIKFQVYLLMTMDKSDEIKSLSSNYDWKDFLVNNKTKLSELSKIPTEYHYKNKVLETEKDKWCMTAIWIGRSQGNYKCHPEFLFESLNEIPQGTIQQGEEAHSGV
tara:strand:- start:12588 stop:14621 length:2034 start_codon:yes stop_codon:yes gene_type:complete